MNRRSLFAGLAGSGTGLFCVAVILLFMRWNSTTLAAVSNQNTVSSGIGTAFTYQGTLTVGGAPAGGAFDFTFALYDAATAGTQVGTTITKNGVSVQNGFFSSELDFGNVFTGSMRYLELAVRPAGGTAFTILAPRQAITPTPYALWAANVVNGKETWEFGQMFADYKTGVISGGGYRYSSEVSPVNATQYINNFTPPVMPKQVESVHFFIGERSGTYTDTVNLSIDVRNYNGVLQRTLSTSTIDLRTASSQQLVTIPLTSNINQRIIQPGEYLGVRVNLGGALAGDFNVSMYFQAQVQDP